MDNTIIISFFIAGIVFVIWKIKQRRNCSLPPGPNLFQLFWNLLALLNRPHLILTRWSQQYGEIYSFYALFKTVIIVSDTDIVKTVFNCEATTARLNEHPIFSAMNQNGHGVSHSEGRTWSEQRKFLLKIISQASNLMHNSIINEASTLAECLSLKNGTPLDIIDDFKMAIGNTFWSVIFNKDASDPTEQAERAEVTNNLFRTFNQITTNVVLFAPWIRLFAPQLTGWTNYKQSIQEMNALTQRYVQEHISTFDADNLRDLADFFIHQIRETMDPNSIFYQQLGETNMVVTLFELLVAGVETTSYSLSWALLYLSAKQEKQWKLKSEIDRVMGTGPVSLRHRANMPYTKAVIMEILRLSSVAPLGVPHSMKEDKVFGSFKFPKGAYIFPNLYAIHKSSKIWGDPESFRPERFLSENGTRYDSHKELMPFGEGKRKCVGAIHAQDTLFVFLTTLFQRFDVVPENPNDKPNFLPRKGSLLLPQPFKVIFLNR